MKADKRVPMERALDLIPEVGARLALGGLTLYRRPIAFALALARRYEQRRAPRELTLLAFTAGLESDLLVAAGMVARVRTCYFGLEIFGLAPAFARAARDGSLDILEESEASLALGLRAAMAGVGFMPSLTWRGTDMLRRRPDVRSVVDPYTGETLTAFPAVHCDVAVIHALRADVQGNAQIGDNWGIDRELSLVAETVILTAEEIVPRLDRADLVAPTVTAVVESPRGAWPCSCHPLYPLDGDAILRYTETAGTESYGPLLDDWRARLGIE